MNMIKKLTGKNSGEYTEAAKLLVNNSDTELFAELVKQDEILFDFVKSNVSKRIKNACNESNYRNLLNFWDYYSPSYDLMMGEVLYSYGGEGLLPEMKERFLNGSDSQKAYAAKYFSFLPNDCLRDLLPDLRSAAFSKFEGLSTNSVEILSKLRDKVSKNNALERLKSTDEFVQYEAVKFLTIYGAKDTLPQIIGTMKSSSLSENIAAEIPYLVPAEELIKSDDGILVLCNIINAIPEIIPLSAVIDYNLFEIFENLYETDLTGSSALLLKLAKDKFAELCANEEYLFDCNKNTKTEVFAVNNFLSQINDYKLKSLFYEELYDESDFVLFAVDYAEEIEVLEGLLNSKNPTLVLKVLSVLKAKNLLNERHKQTALENISKSELKEVISAL